MPGIGEELNVSYAMELLNGAQRNQSPMVPRQMAMYLCRLLLSSSFPEIAMRIGGTG